MALIDRIMIRFAHKHPEYRCILAGADLNKDLQRIIDEYEDLVDMSRGFGLRVASDLMSWTTVQGILDGFTKNQADTNNIIKHLEEAIRVAPPSILADLKDTKAKAENHLSEVGNLRQKAIAARDVYRRRYASGKLLAGGNLLSKALTVAFPLENRFQLEVEPVGFKENPDWYGYQRFPVSFGKIGDSWFKVIFWICYGMRVTKPVESIWGGYEINWGNQKIQKMVFDAPAHKAGWPMTTMINNFRKDAKKLKVPTDRGNATLDFMSYIKLLVSRLRKTDPQASVDGTMEVRWMNKKTDLYYKDVTYRIEYFPGAVGLEDHSSSYLSIVINGVRYTRSHASKNFGDVTMNDSEFTLFINEVATALETGQPPKNLWRSR